MSGNISTDICGGVGDDVLKKKFEHPLMHIEEIRKNSYENWPKILSSLIDELVEDGFFYTGYGDKVECYKCGGRLKNWYPHHDVQRRHDFHFPQCLEKFPIE